MQKTQIRFGTDGWRGVIAEDFTFENVRRVAQATADYWNSQPLPKSAIVGYDNRFFSEVFAKLVCEVLAANGIRPLYPPVAVPTPAVSFAVRDRNLAGAVMITASHNPPQFNGYKLKADFAGPATPEYCREVEALLDRSPVRAVPFEGNAEIYDPRPAHVAAVQKLVDVKLIRNAGLRIAVDSMHGCGGRQLEEVLAGPKCRVQTIRADRNPLFGGTNPEPIAKNLRPLCDAVRRTRAHLGIATDGDADRLGIVDDRGRYLSIQLVFAMLLLHLIRHRQQTSGVVVKSTNSTYLVERICRAHGLKCVEVPVGFKHICQQMREHDVLIGGEESGGIGFRGHIPERDGMLANLMLLELLATTKRSVTQIVAGIQKEFGPSAYDRIDMAYPLDKRDKFIELLRTQPPKDLAGSPLAKVNDSDGVKYIAKDDTWLMFRTSGTEPIIRIYSEAGTSKRVRTLLELGRRLAVKVEKS